MQRMTGLDAAFLAMETPGRPMHTLKLFVLEPLEGVEKGALPAHIDAGLAAYLPRLPALRRRAWISPHGLRRAVWIEDAAFAVERHVHRLTVEAPGGERELDAAIAGLAAEPLPRDRPLWALWAIDGLAGGHVAVLVKIHHALADGQTVARMLHRVTSRSPTAMPETAAPSAMEHEPRAIDVWRHSLVARAEVLRAAPELVARTVGSLRALRAYRRGGGPGTPLPLRDVPRSPLNGTLGSARTFASTALPLAVLRAIKSRHAVSLNDVYLAVLAGALRRTLGDALPSRPLIASVPTSADAPEDADGGNHVSSLFVALPTDVPDPLARLRQVHAGATAGKRAQQILGKRLMEDWAELLPTGVMHQSIRAFSALRLAEVLPPPINLVASNVPGPAAPLFVPGHRLVAIRSVGPVLEGVGLNVTAWSYVDALHVSALGDARLVPDPRSIVDAMHDALSELDAA